LVQERNEIPAAADPVLHYGGAAVGSRMRRSSLATVRQAGPTATRRPCRASGRCRASDTMPPLAAAARGDGVDGVEPWASYAFCLSARCGVEENWRREWPTGGGRPTSGSVSAAWQPVVPTPSAVTAARGRCREAGRRHLAADGRVVRSEETDWLLLHKAERVDACLPTGC
jgi:hypothetical protein